MGRIFSDRFGLSFWAQVKIGLAYLLGSSLHRGPLSFYLRQYDFVWTTLGLRQYGLGIFFSFLYISPLFFSSSSLKRPRGRDSLQPSPTVSDSPPPVAIHRMPDPAVVKEVKRAVSVPVMARTRVGHFMEAQILESLAVDYMDESEIISRSLYQQA